MIIGKPERFAIEAEPREREGEWIWGGFRFWVGNRQIGDWEDAAALQLCYRWLRKLSEQPPDCVEPRLANSPAKEVFKLVVEPVISANGVADPSKQPIPFAYERFHITYVGMSSFDSFVVVLVKDAVGNERCLWRNVDEVSIGEQWLEPGELERVARDFCEQFEREWILGKDH